IKGRDLSQVSQRDALRFLGGYDEPITLQIEGRRGKQQHQRQRGLSRRTTDCSTQTERHWDAFRCLGIPEGPTPSYGAYTDRQEGLRCCGPASVPCDHYTANRYLPSIPISTADTDQLGRQEPELSSRLPKRRSCLIGCCNADVDEPSSFLSQTEDEDLVVEKPLGCLHLLHELDSGLGCTDGSFHQGELSAAETEEGVEEPVSSPPGRTSRGSSPSSESLISSELSDSGFYSVSTGEFRRFQRLLERKIRLYKARMIPRDQREGLKACWDLESIPEALTCQPQSSWSPEARAACPAHRYTKGLSSVQFRKSGSPRLSRYGSGAGSMFSTPAGPSHCSTPSCQRRPSLPRQNSSTEYLWRSHTLHRPGPVAMERRRASHPASPNYHAAMTHHCKEFATGFQKGADFDCGVNYVQRGTSTDPQNLLPRELCSLGGGREFCQGHPGEQHERETQQQEHFHTLGHPQEVHETWPKSAYRCTPRKGLYSTLDSHGPHHRRALSGNPRAVRNQLLKARALRLADERSEVTTDEEARGEVRTGRYWSKTERRRHLHLAREQRQRRMARAGPVASSDTGGLRPSNCNAVLELSHRKLSRLRNRKLLDDWTTVEELLTHGTRVGSSEEILCPSPLLSVTTV
ncbi:hypothetical protein GN956_G9664, partial [Arapaima gigas]